MLHTGGNSTVTISGVAIQGGDTTVEGAGVVDGSLELANAGDNEAHENRQPFLALNYIICLAGK